MKIKYTLHIAIAALVVTGAVAAQEIVTPEQFDEISTNKTLYFNSGERFHGAEQYFPNRKVTWKFANGECDQGFWFPQGDAICFSYTQNPEPQCWNFIQDGDRFLARLLGGDPANDLELTFVDTKELLCEAPYLGASFAR
tara:strand:+ start:2512 stop:2931 length:420 start_codon:yes stop_codon:yes gene_type:complete